MRCKSRSELLYNATISVSPILIPTTDFDLLLDTDFLSFGENG